MNMSKKSRIPKEETWDNLHGERCDFFLHTESLRRPHNWAKECWNMDQYVQKMLIFFLRRLHTFYKHYMSQSYMHLNSLWFACQLVLIAWQASIFIIWIKHSPPCSRPCSSDNNPRRANFHRTHIRPSKKEMWQKLIRATNLVTTSLKSSLSRK